MKITYLEQERVFHLKTPEMSYAFGVAPDGRLLHLYWGQPLSQDASLACMMQDAPLSQDASVTYITQEAAKAQKSCGPWAITSIASATPTATRFPPASPPITPSPCSRSFIPTACAACG